MDYLKAFVVGGLICVVGQILIDKTKLTPARILTSFVVIGVLLGAVGLYKPLVDLPVVVLQYLCPVLGTIYTKVLRKESAKTMAWNIHRWCYCICRRNSRCYIFRFFGRITGKTTGKILGKYR